MKSHSTPELSGDWEVKVTHTGDGPCKIFLEAKNSKDTHILADWVGNFEIKKVIHIETPDSYWVDVETEGRWEIEIEKITSPTQLTPQ